MVFIKEIQDHIYFNDIIFVTGNDEEIDLYFEKEYKMENLFQELYEAQTIQLCDDGVFTTVIKITDPERTEVLFHELCHHSINVFDNVGMDINKHTEEAFAYYMGYITKMFFETNWERYQLVKKNKDRGYRQKSE